MTITEAASMLQQNGKQLQGKTWADLGCGSGTFTLALASLLPQQSIIYAMDEQQQSLSSLPAAYLNVSIKTQVGDFVKDAFPFEKVNGILMANALHYVKDKLLFLAKIKTHLSNNGCLLIVEYNTDKPVARWVPFPVSFQSLKKLMNEAGFGTVTKLHSRNSAFGGEMYSAMIEM